LPVPLVDQRPVGFQAPRDLVDAVRRLAEAREVLARTGEVRLRYSEDQLRSLVAKGEVPQPRYLVRLTANELTPEKAMGTLTTAGFLPLWATTFEQLEPADSDPEVLTRVLGMPYDPAKHYTLLVFRNDAGRWPPMVCPTVKAIAELAARDLSNAFFTPQDLREAMDPAYQPTYRMLMAAFYRRGFKETSQDDVERFITDDSVLHDPLAARRFRSRLRIHVQYGANEFFSGDGVTQVVDASERKLGVQELFVLDTSPQPIGAYENTGKLVRVPCRPMSRNRPARFVGP
jgi:hypothetical protein